MVRLILLTGVSIVAVHASTAMAQATGTDVGADDRLSEIVVTADRNERSLQDVPISISAFSAQALEKSNVTEAKDYLQFAPNIVFTEDGATGPRSIDVAIRGVGNIKSSDLVTTSSAIGYYIDELNVGAVANGTINPQMLDVERIEVLRGPQGTYFGRNSLGGAVSINTVRPKDRFEAEVSGSYGSFDTWDFRGILNVPLAEGLYVRGAYLHSESGGVVKNVNPNGAPDSGYVDNTARFALRAEPGSGLTIDASLSYTRENAGLDDTVPSGVIDNDTKQTLGNANLMPISQGLGFYPENQRLVNHNAPEYNRNRFLIANMRVKYEGELVDLSSVTGYLYSRNSRLFDQDNISADIFNRVVKGHTKSYSQELRIASKPGSSFKWTFGGLAARDYLEQFSNVYVGSARTYTDPLTGVTTRYLPDRFPDGFPLNQRNRTSKVNSYAVFGEGVYRLGRVSFTLGARYTRDKVQATQFGVLASNVPLPDAGASSSFNDFSPRLVVNYDVNDGVHLYTSVSSGYKAGGVDINRSVVRAFKPEKLWSYEAGFKTQLLDRRLRVNGALYYLDWKNIQVVSAFLADPNDISSSTQLTLNASKATSKGAELEVQALPMRGLQLGLNAGYLDAKFGAFPDAVVFGGGQFDLTGKRVPKSPKWNLSGNAEYGFDLTSSADAYVRAEAVYRSSLEGNLDATAAPLQGLAPFPYLSPSYTVVNVRAGLNAGPISAQVFVENLFKKDYFSGTYDHFGLAGIRLKPHPRLWGLRLTWKTN